MHLNGENDKFRNKNRNSRSRGSPSTVERKVGNKADGHTSHISHCKLTLKIKRGEYAQTYERTKAGEKVYETNNLHRYHGSRIFFRRKQHDKRVCECQEIAGYT